MHIKVVFLIDWKLLFWFDPNSDLCGKLLVFFIVCYKILLGFSTCSWFFAHMVLFGRQCGEVLDLLRWRVGWLVVRSCWVWNKVLCRSIIHCINCERSGMKAGLREGFGVWALDILSLTEMRPRIVLFYCQGWLWRI